ncbi:MULTISPECIES: Ku protein [unclassified Yoonia]|uniref:non-homologous end joining protein Ku n=1 Tax=unclassified Yoonia TaxID=2629118 RepID=UPI002AFF3F53|nr:MULTISPECIES: Ku protein [unclassified Yoonia]
MAARPVWKGQLRLSLVSIPVEMFTATVTGARVSFRQIHKPSGKPINYEKVAAGVGPVDKEDIFSGFEIEKDEFILIDPKEIDAIKLETKKTFELVQFVGNTDISPLYYEKPYYLVPSDELAQDAYRVVRDALRTAGKVGLGQITMRGKERLAAVRPCGDGLLVETLRYADEVREADPLFADINDDETDADLLEVATALIDKKTAPFKADNFKDNYAIALREMIEAKRTNRKTPRVSTDGAPTAASGNVIDLMAALKQSLGKSGPKKTTPKKPPAKATKSRAK